MWIVQVLSKRSTDPYPCESHSAAACGSFKSFLPSEHQPRLRANPTARQRVNRSSPFYSKRTNPVCARIPHRGSVWIVQVLSTASAPTPYARESHSAAACGSFKSFLPSEHQPRMRANPTARQRVDHSSPFYWEPYIPSGALRARKDLERCL